MNFSQGIERLPMHISRRDFFLTSRYVIIINEIKIHLVFSPNEDGFKTPAFWLLLSYTLCIFLLKIYFPIALPKLWGSQVVWVKIFAFRSCQGHFVLTRIHLVTKIRLHFSRSTTLTFWKIRKGWNFSFFIMYLHLFCNWDHKAV